MAFTERGALGLTNRSRPDARLVERDSVHRLREVERPSSDLFFMVLVYMIGHFGGLKKLPPRLYRRVLGNWPDANGETSLRSRFQSKETDAKAKKKTHTHTHKWADTVHGLFRPLVANTANIIFPSQGALWPFRMPGPDEFPGPRVYYQGP